MNYKLSMLVLSQVRRISCSCSLSQKKNHYQSLGLRKSATQTDVKNAYYELSKVYHPDKNQGHTVSQRDQHSQKFRDITEAYEVLGNVKTRRLYDKGIMAQSSSSHSEPPTPQDPLHKFYKSREVRTRPPRTDGTQPIYDFDEWARQHYGSTLRKKQESREKNAFYDYHEKMRQEKKTQYETLIIVGFFILAICMLIKEAKEEMNKRPITPENVNTVKENGIFAWVGYTHLINDYPANVNKHLGRINSPKEQKPS